MRIAGKKLTAAEVKDMGTPGLLQQLMFFAAAYDAKQTRSAESSMRLLLAEIAQRCGYSPLEVELDHIIKHY